MEIEKLIAALEETITYLQKSESPDWSSMPTEEIIRKLEVEISKARNAKPMDVYTLEILFAPTGVIQETSIDNGWGTRFLRLSEIVDDFIGG
ncbi:MAG TPA: hypothetical protein VJ830_09765 [Anaerolineales bacterium]|nr:hypothetical protein [Anaerolineales bacterium]